MALSPLHDAAVNPPEGATVEIHYKLDGSAAIAYSAPPISTPLDFPYTPESDIWLPNGLYEWRYMTEALAYPWRAFRAFAGVGAEGLFDSDLSTPVSLDDPMPANGSPAALDSITIPDLGYEKKIGFVAVTINLAFDHMWDLYLTMLAPDGSTGVVWHGFDFLSDSSYDFAFDGTLRLLSSKTGEAPFNEPLLDGHAYNTLSDFVGPAAGTWTLQWEAEVSPAFGTHAGLYRDPMRIELIPA